MKERDKLMPLMSIFGIILVVLGHSGYSGSNISEDFPHLCTWIYNFHMPLFFFISGYLFSLTNPDFRTMNGGALLKKKVLRLLVPYFVLGIVLFAIKFAFAGLASVERAFSPGLFCQMFVAPGCEGSTMGYLWYLITLFVVFAVVALLSAVGVNLKNGWQCLGTVVVSWTLGAVIPNCEWLNLSAVLWYLPFFVIGILFNVFKDKVLKIAVWGGNILIFSALSVLLVWIDSPLPPFFHKVAAALTGIWMTLCLCAKVAECESLTARLVPWGKYTYSIYLLSWFGQYATKFLMVNVLHLGQLPSVVAMFIMGLLVPIAVDWVVDRIDPRRRCKALHLVIGY